MLRKILFFGLMTVAGTVFGQNRNTADKVDRPNTKKINFGVRAGFNSSMFMVSELKIKDVTIDEVQNNYKIGYFGALFMRINMKKHYIQPEVSYNVTICEITFDNSALNIRLSSRIMLRFNLYCTVLTFPFCMAIT